MKKHIDNHLNPHSSKARRNVTNQVNTTASLLNATNLTNTIAAVASGGSSADALASKAASNFLAMEANKNNLSPRMTPIVKHELYFPQCYGSPFNQSFPGGAGTPLIQEVGNGANGGGGVAGSEVEHVNNNNSGESSPTGIAVNGTDTGVTAVTR